MNRPFFKTYLLDFLALLFPKSCISCSEALYRQEELICTACKLDLPRTNFHLKKTNPLQNRLTETPDVAFISAFLLFRRRGKVQKLIHALKYQNKPEVGYMLGLWYAHDLQKADVIPSNAVLLPIPLHPKKLKKRGYNQAEAFGQGLADGLKLPQIANALLRMRHTETQTRKSREDRYANVDDLFVLNSSCFDAITNRPVFIVDDVITTGATLQSAVKCIRQVQPSSIGILTLTVAG